MKMKWFLLPVIVLAVISIAATSCDLMGGGKDSGGGTISWVASADGVVDTTTSTKITFTFEKDPTGLQAGDITITTGTGKATRGTLSGSGTSRELTVTGVEQGTVKIKIAKSGIATLEQPIYVYAAVDPTLITWTATPNGEANTAGTGTETSSMIIFEFFGASEPVTLAIANIKIDDGTGATGGKIRTPIVAADLTKPYATAGFYILEIEVEKAGVISVKIEKTGINTAAQDVTVFVEGKRAGEDAADPFVAVSGITLTSPRGSIVEIDSECHLGGTVAPEDATNQEIVWSIKAPAPTGVSIADDDTLTLTDAVTADKVVVVATISNGLTETTNYTQEFEIEISDVPLTGEPIDGTVSITGTAEVGETLTANTSLISGTTGAFTYQWKRAASGETGTDITGADAETYELVADDLGKYITVTVQRAGFYGSKTSAATGPVLAAGGHVTFSGVTANGSTTATTTELTLTFNKAIAGLAVGDITLSGVTGIAKGTLTGTGPEYILAISGFTAGGTVSVAVTKTGFDISGSPKTATINYAAAEPEPDDPLVFNNPQFVGWGGVNGTTNTFDFISTQYDSMITWDIPTEAADYETVKIYYELEKLTAGDDRDNQPMKFTVKRSAKDDWSGSSTDNAGYSPNHTADGTTFNLEYDVEFFTSNVITIAHNTYFSGIDDNRSDFAQWTVATFKITITKIEFSGYDG